MTMRRSLQSKDQTEGTVADEEEAAAPSSEEALEVADAEAAVEKLNPSENDAFSGRRREEGLELEGGGGGGGGRGDGNESREEKKFVLT
jgi:hypothetical protein